MKFSVEAWAPEYGFPVDSDLDEPTTVRVDVAVERPVERWEPIAPDPGSEPGGILFVDGVRRVDARVWVQDHEGRARPGICASYAAGAVHCDGRARVVAASVQRGFFTAAAGAEAIISRHAAYPVRAAPGETPEQFALALQQRMGELEVEMAAATPTELVVVDGPLTGRRNLPGAVGLIKTHQVAYLPSAVEPVVGRLGPGERTPLFLTMTSWSRFSWYLRLPGGSGHPWAGVVRCEAFSDMQVSQAISLADVVSIAIPRFSSAPHKDPRAPQNLYPIAGLERYLRRRLGDPLLLYRALREAAGTASI